MEIPCSGVWSRKSLFPCVLCLGVLLLGLSPAYGVVEGIKLIVTLGTSSGTTEQAKAEAELKHIPSGLTEQAKVEAHSNASKLALEEAIGLLIPYDKLEANRQIVEDQILAEAEKFAVTDEIAFLHLRPPDPSRNPDAVTNPGATTVQVRYFADMERIKEALDKLNLLKEVMPPLNAILLTRTEVDGVPFDEEILRGIFLRKMKDLGVVNLESDALTEALAKQMPFHFEDRAALLELGKEFAADQIILIDARGRAKDAKMLLTDTLCPCQVEVQAVALDIASATDADKEKFSAEAEESHLADSARKAFERCGALLTETFLPRVSGAWADRYNTGTLIRLELNKITYDFSDRVQREMSSLSWVNSVKRVNLIGDAALFDVSVRDDETGFSATLSHLPNVSLDMVEVTRKKIIAKPKPGFIPND